MLKHYLDKSRGNEIFIGGLVNEDKSTIESVQSIFYGNEDQVLFNLDISTDFDIILHNHPSGILKLSEADSLIANECQKLGIGFGIFDNSVGHCYIAIPPHSVHKRKKIKLDEINRFFKNPPDSIFETLPSYNYRDSQNDLAVDIARVINEDKIGLFEAPTGIGKSLAYLVPSFIFLSENKSKIVISTYTKNLQNQLFRKDIPSLLKVMKLNLKVELFLGRQNYLCKFKYNTFKQSANLSLFEMFDADLLSKIDQWACTTKSGIFQEIQSSYPRNLIDELRSDSSSCLGKKCSFYSECFFYNAKRAIANADIIITNHHLLLSYELFEDFNDSFPPYNTVIFDEAHNLAGVIEDISTLNFATDLLVKKLSRLISQSVKQSNLIDITKKNLNTFLKKNNELQAKIDAIIELLDDVSENTISLIQLAGTLVNETIYSLTEKLDTGESRQKFRKSENGYLAKNINITSMLKFDKETVSMIFDSLSPFFNKTTIVYDLVSSCYDKVNELVNLLQKKSDEDTTFQNILYFIGYLKNLLDYLLNGIEIYKYFEKLLKNDDKDDMLAVDSDKIQVLWLEKTKTGIEFNLFDENSSSKFSDYLYMKPKSSVLISATMTAENKFQYIKSQIYLQSDLNNRIVEKIFPYIFNYSKNSAIFVPQDIKEPGDPDFLDNVARTIEKIALKYKSKIMILTTSFYDIKKLYDYLIRVTEKTEKTIIKQDEFSNTAFLMEKFRSLPDAILIATMSFWEGVDFPGKDLEILVITKVPFKVPDTPIFLARSEKLESKGFSSFENLSLPYAILKLKQGFGRLIRSENEKGICIIFDSRLIKKNYGKRVLKSLPDSQLLIYEEQMFMDLFKAKAIEFSFEEYRS
jgi:ATP-dependent DNA helicase DinG